MTRAAFAVLLPLMLLLSFVSCVVAHPLGNFTVNHFTRLEIGAGQVRLHYVVDMAEIPTFQESQAIDTDGDGQLAGAELDAYLQRVTAAYATGLVLEIDGARVPLQLASQTISLPQGAGGLPTLRVECDATGELSALEPATAHRLRFENLNQRERIGWNEIVIVPASGIYIFDSTAFGSAVTDELKAYPQDMLSAPLAEHTAELSFTRGQIPTGATVLSMRDGRPVAAQTRDHLAELISVAEITPMVALLGLFVAAALGAVHALSPGHGKAVVGAYLVGSKGTPKHAIFLGLTVTITHTLGVFALGFVTLFASRYVLPEKLFPLLGLASGAIVLLIGFTLFVKRLRAALGSTAHTHHAHAHTHGHEHEHKTDGALTHSHGGSTHTHLPPGADGGKVTWRSLLALGISGGLLPCPSALVVMLSAISLGRVGYGLFLIVAFSLGLSATLTSIGLAFIYAGRLFKRPILSGKLARLLPVASAFVIACLGALVCYEAFAQTGFDAGAAFNSILLWAKPPTEAGSLTAVSVLAFGFVLGLKHATEADHVAAVSTIVSEQRSVLGSSLVGGLWGAGHTISLFVVGLAVIVLHVRIGERLALALEFCVGLMLIGLGANALRKLMRGGKLHFHPHRHGEHEHAHPHLHDGSPEMVEHTHHGFKLGARPLIIGLVHGLAGSAALMLLVLSTISSPLVGLGYIAVFGIGSIGGMMLMSALVSLPVYLTAMRFSHANLVIRGLAGLFSLSFGLFITYQIGFIDGLFR